MTNFRILIATLFVFGQQLSAQELTGKVTVNASMVNTTVDKRIFTTLQTQLTNFITSRKWTNDKYNSNERIQCNFLLNIETIADENIYQGKLIVQSSRPVYGAAYQAAMVNYQDADITFKYVEYQPLEFNENRVSGSDPYVGNLTATMAYYAYLILGMDYASFSLKGGEPYFQKAMNIVNNAPEGSKIKGWKAFDGLRNRYWLAENLTNPKNNILHDIIYGYYRNGLDKLSENEKAGRSGMMKVLNSINNFAKENINQQFVQFFIQGKNRELIGIFTNGTEEEKTKASDILSYIDVSNADQYKQQLK